LATDTEKASMASPTPNKKLLIKNMSDPLTFRLNIKSYYIPGKENFNR